ncbi:hypothetical protein BCR44DRAFT_1440683 [Catenaria anguillulae PL171]|uniref:Uncharacterized protein n=1 Tax=Catenaria anguillulae PL171 TaxID=765915 RepID=A0A1Y2HC94_9FUNG|nr:hypothetical protein BCR44DRAFT_1440683 [Catenaria anguillulae PL171]
MLKDRDQVLDQTRRELEMLKDQYMAEISKNKALAELYNTSHERRRRVIEELAMVKITLDRVVEEKEKLLGVMMAESAKQGPPVPPLPASPEGASSKPLRRSASVSSNKAVRFADQVVTHAQEQEEEDDDGASSEDTELSSTRPAASGGGEAAASAV